MYRLIFLLLITVIFESCDQDKTNELKDPADHAATLLWHQQPLRILQTVLREPDAEDYDVDSVINYMQRVHANVLVINGGGIVDYFQNTLPMSNVNPYIDTRDLLRDIVDGCHQNGIRVITRIDFRGVEQARYEEHPDWFARDEQNNPIVLNYTTPPLYAPCYNGYYRNEHAVRFIEQLFEKYEIDGIWHNAVNFHHTCYCDRCQELYLQAYNKKIPVRESPETEWADYYLWNQEMASRQLAKMRSTVKKYGDDKSYAAEVFDMYRVEQQKHTGIDLYSAADYFDFLVTVSFIANNSYPVHYKDIYYPSAIVRFLKSLESKKPPVILFGGNGTEHRYIFDPSVDSRLWLWETVGTGGGFWNCYFNGSFPANTLDRRNAYIAQDAYEYLMENSALINDLHPVTDVAVFYSKPTGQLLGDKEFSLPLKGIFRLLEEEHFQYGFVFDRQLSLDKLNNFRVLIMPNVAALSNKNAEIIRKWVKGGGKLIATFQTSLYDERGQTRQDFGLKDLFGASYDGAVASTETDCYQKIKTRTPHLNGFEKTELLHNSGRTLMVTPVNEAVILTGYLPRINNQPPEYAYPQLWETDRPIMVFHRFGEGQVIYFANEMARLNYTIGHPDYTGLLTNSIHELLGEHQVLKTNAPASVHVYLNQYIGDEHTYQLSVINTSSATRRPIRQLVPVTNIEIQLPFRIENCENLFGTGTDFRIEGSRLYISRVEEFCSFRLSK